MTTRDYVYLIASLQAIDDKRFNCAECLNQFVGNGQRKEMIAKSRFQKGCEQSFEKPIHRVMTGLQFRNCPGNYNTPMAAKFLEMFEAYSRGILPYPGALSEQPKRIMEIFDVIRAYKWDKLRTEELNRKKGRRGKRN